MTPPSGRSGDRVKQIGISRASDLSGRVDNVTFPQRISYITLGVREMATLRAFYAELGWQERPGSSDDFATFEAEGVLLALYPDGQLGQEAAPGSRCLGGGGTGSRSGSMSRAPRLSTRRSVRLWQPGLGAVAGPVKREWGGYSGYIADPEGNRWEITWAPG